MTCQWDPSSARTPLYLWDLSKFGLKPYPFRSWESRTLILSPQKSHSCLFCAFHLWVPVLIPAAPAESRNTLEADSVSPSISRGNSQGIRLPSCPPFLLLLLPLSFLLYSFFFLAFPLVFSPFLSLLIGGGKALRIWGVARSHFLGEQVSTIWFPAPPSHLLSSSLLVTSTQGTLKNVFPLSPVRQKAPKGIQFFPLGFILPIDTFVAGFLGGIVVKNLPANAGDVGSIPGCKIHHKASILTTNYSISTPGSQAGVILALHTLQGWGGDRVLVCLAPTWGAHWWVCPLSFDQSLEFGPWASDQSLLEGLGSFLAGTRKLIVCMPSAVKTSLWPMWWQWISWIKQFINVNTFLFINSPTFY